VQGPHTSNLHTTSSPVSSGEEEVQQGEEEEGCVRGGRMMVWWRELLRANRHYRRWTCCYLAARGVGGQAAPDEERKRVELVSDSPVSDGRDGSDSDGRDGSDRDGRDAPVSHRDGRDAPVSHCSVRAAGASQEGGAQDTRASARGYISVEEVSDEVGVARERVPIDLKTTKAAAPLCLIVCICVHHRAGKQLLDAVCVNACVATLAEQEASILEEAMRRAGAC